MRQDKWTRRLHDESLKKRYQEFRAGGEQFLRTLDLSHDTISENIDKRGRNKIPRQPLAHPSDKSISVVSSAAELRDLQQAMQLLEVGGIGHMPSKKRGGMVRIAFENWNSLGVYSNTWKIDKLNGLIKRLQLDIIAGCEVQCDWRFVSPDKQFTKIVAPGNEK